MANADITVNVGLEPTEEAKQFVRGLVLEALQELFAENQWVEQRIQEITERAMHKTEGQLRLAGRPLETR